MRLRSLFSAVMLMAASSAASAAAALPALPGLALPGLGVITTLPALSLPAIPGVAVLTGNPAFAGFIGTGLGGSNALLTPLLGPLYSAGNTSLPLPGLSGGVPAIPGLLPLPALPIPVTQMALSFGGYDMLFGSLEGLSPVVLALPDMPGVTTIFANY